MARQGRLLVDGGLYHITNRGHNRYRLFHSLNDYKTYKKEIRNYKKSFNPQTEIPGLKSGDECDCFPRGLHF